MTRNLAVASSIMLLAGCLGASPHFGGLIGSGCSDLYIGQDHLFTCAAGCTARDNVACSGSCSAEWVHNGTTLYRKTQRCDDMTHSSEIIPLQDGSIIKWRIDGDVSEGATAIFTVAPQHGLELILKTRCLTALWG